LINIHKVETYFDKFYRTFKEVRYDPAGNVQADAVYDAEGRVSSVSQPYRTGSPVWTTTAYDAADRPVTVTKPDGSVVQYSYPALDRVTETDEAGNARTTGYTTSGGVAWVSDGIVSTSYQQSLFGPLSVNQAGQWRTFTYDWLGRQTSASHPESGTTSYGYDDAGRMTSRTDARNVTAWTSYDAIDRPLTTSYSDGTPTVTRTYDQNGYTGFLTTVTDGAGSTTFTYNTAGQLASESRTFNGVSGSFTTSYSYDLAGKLQSITYPSGRVVAYSYQSGGGLATGRLDRIVDQTMNRTIVENVSDNAAGQITGQTLGNGIVETRSFNNRFQVSAMAASHGGPALLNLSFGYGNPGQNTGQIRSRTDAIQPEHSVQYTYDAVGRLTSAVNEAWNSAGVMTPGETGQARRRPGW
jgi:YD repeat-containing protein